MDLLVEQALIGNYEDSAVMLDSRRFMGCACDIINLQEPSINVHAINSQWLEENVSIIIEINKIVAAT